MPKNKVYASVFIDDVKDWRFLNLGGNCAVTDNSPITLHFTSLVALGNFAEKLMDLYNAAKSSDN